MRFCIWENTTVQSELGLDRKSKIRDPAGEMVPVLVLALLVASGATWIRFFF